MVIFKNLSGDSKRTEIITTAIDLAKTASAFASDTTAIEPLLRQIQTLASTIPPSGLITPEEEKPIFDIYLKLEHYLITADPIRKFTKEDLRNKASQGLLARLQAYEAEIPKNQ